MAPFLRVVPSSDQTATQDVSLLTPLVATKVRRSPRPEQTAGYDHRHFQPPVRGLDQVLGSERLTGALLDRLTHHVSILTM